MDKEILPGTRVMVFDPWLFEDDKTTPIAYTVRPATVIRRYGCVSQFMLREYGVEASRYPDLVDVRFDHRPEKISHGHFTSGVEIIDRSDDMNKVKSSLWFTCSNGETIGIVLTSDNRGYLRAFLGKAHGETEQDQLQWIANNGSCLPKEVAMAAFPGWDKKRFEPNYMGVLQ